MRHGKHWADLPLLSPPPLCKPRKQNMNGGTDSGISALSMVSTTHSEKRTRVHQLVANRLSVDHFPVYQHRDNGREAFAISKSSGKLHLSESAVQCPKCVVLSKGRVSIATGSSECRTRISQSHSTWDVREGTSRLNWCTLQSHKWCH